DEIGVFRRKPFLLEPLLGEFAKERLQQERLSPEDADFIGRNIAKAQLAFGDAILAALGQYHWSCRERNRRLQQIRFEGELAWAEPLAAEHAEGVAFKLHPVRAAPSRDRLLAAHKRLLEHGQRLWLWLEGKRLGAAFASPREYGLSPINKCPETPPWRNLLVNLRQWGPAILADPRRFRYPRERLLNALALLLWNAEPDPEIQKALAVLLRGKASSFSEWTALYRALWNRFN
ncbi:MAG: hypothetical protein J7M29_05315, partial [Verrucomicrobia bacterium]|nr:hypothetical protein [Verrucomicrobiota bacterium]